MKTEKNYTPVAVNQGQLNGQSVTAKKATDEHVLEAHRQADHDIEMDKDFQAHSRTHDLDEGEIARLGS